MVRPRNSRDPFFLDGIRPVSLIFQMSWSFFKKASPSSWSWEATKRSSTYTKIKTRPLDPSRRNRVDSNVSVPPILYTVLCSSRNHNKGARRRPFIALASQMTILLPWWVIFGGSNTRSMAPSSTGAFINATLTSAVRRWKLWTTEKAKTHLKESNELVGA